MWAMPSSVEGLYIFCFYQRLRQLGANLELLLFSCLSTALSLATDLNMQQPRSVVHDMQKGNATVRCVNDTISAADGGRMQPAADERSVFHADVKQQPPVVG